MSETHKVVMSEYIRATVRLDRTYFVTGAGLAEIMERKDDMAYFLDADCEFEVAEYDEEIVELHDNIRTDVVVDGRLVY